MARRRVTVDLEDVEAMLGQLAEKLDEQGKVTAEEVAAVDPLPAAEARARQPRTLRRRLAEDFKAGPILGWPLTVFLWLIIAVNLYLIAAWCWLMSADGFYLPDFAGPLDLLGFIVLAMLANLFPLLRIAAAFQLFRYRRLGMYLYGMPTLLWIGWQLLQPPDESTFPFLLREIFFLAILGGLLLPKWHDFE
ncbi:MAG: hypothetical protein ACYDCO_26025 [Armatimonadota bacterium]